MHYPRLRKVNTDNVDQHVTEDDIENDTDFDYGQATADNNIEDTEHAVTEVQGGRQIEAEHHTNDCAEPDSGTEQRTDVSLKTRQIVKYRDKDSGIFHTAKVLGRAGKATGKNKHW